MRTEYEIKILEINKEEMVTKLENLGAKRVGDYHQKRYVYDIISAKKNSWIRLRTNGIKTTLAYKKIESNTIDGTKELEIEVSSFEDTNELLKQMGYYPKGFQENKRIQYIIDEIEIDIDTWPKIPTYLEIEGSNEKEIKELLTKLDISETKISTLDVESIYNYYGFGEVRDLKFEEE